MKAPRREMCDALGEGSEIVSKVVLGKVSFSAYVGILHREASRRKEGFKIQEEKTNYM